ncbi:Pre-mRNA-splicing factor syf2 [Cytospora mali]|uniref:Pre-mRNA-splicing factor SYF2 n=1 Tax=Cytospora mali TaxID=578113 RepID=A0A194V9P9_CYTMA|nr:Pre-mRNA-splicing factor syf2 [Valsa mali var. pyri (nom. inval.)]
MPPAKKRKTAATAKGGKRGHVVTATAEPSPPPTSTADEAQTTVAPEPSEEPSTPTPAEEPQAQAQEEETTAPESSTAPAPAPAPAPGPSVSVQDRMARFRALQSRAKSSSASNLSAAQTEAHRLANDPAQLATIQRKSAIASNKLLKADIEDEGGDFERKRAWDWTVDESEKWDKRVAKKERHRDDIAFADYRREANKVYKRQLKNLGDPDLERYTREKMKAIEEAAARGTLELVETEDGEMVAVDKDGTFYGGGGGDVISSFADNKPDKKAVDRLVGEMKKAEEVAAKKRRERLAKNGDDGDVTYINDKNKQFNQKLARFYNKYTAEIRDSFERGTMI